MANKLIEELIINVKQKGAKPTEKSLQKVADSLEDAAAGAELFGEALNNLPKMLQHVEAQALKTAKATKSIKFDVTGLGDLNEGITHIIGILEEFHEDTIAGNKGIVNSFENLANSLGYDLDRVQDSLIDVEKATSGVGKSFDNMNKKGRRAGNGLANQNRQGRNSVRTFSDLAKVAGPIPDLYAKIAANAFALSEAFRLLAEGEQLNRLKEAGEIMSTRVGVPISNTAKLMQELTGDTLSFGDSMRQAAAAVAYGFDSKQIEQLTMAARRASVALGVDMQDAMNRVIRGTSKLEIELLDELGITTKLTTAYEKYAAQIGVSALALNSYQQRAALVNEINEQSVQKFGDLDTMLRNGAPWEKFGANMKTAMQDLLMYIAQATSGLAGFFNKMSEQSPAQKLIEQIDATYKTYQRSGEMGQRSGMFGSAAEMIEQRKQLEAIEKQAMATAAAAEIGSEAYAGAMNEANRASHAISVINQKLKETGIDAQSIQIGTDAYKNLQVVAASTAKDFVTQLANIKGQTKAYNQLYTSAKDLSKAFNIVKSADPYADLGKAISELGFSSVAEMNRMVALTGAYRNAQIGVEQLGLRKQKLAAIGIRDNVPALETEMKQLRAQKSVQEQLLSSSRALGVQQGELAKIRAELIGTNMKLLDTQNKLSAQKTEQVMQGISAQETAGAISNLQAAQQRLATEQVLLDEYKRQNATYEERIGVLNNIKTLEAQITAIQNQRARDQANAYMQGLTSGTGMGVDDKQQVQLQERADMYTSALGQLTSQMDGLDSMATAFQSLTLAASGFGDTASNALQMTSVGLQGFAGLLKMTSNAAVSSIDAQIAMEQKRDGKSAESQAKIKQLEAKKIKEQQKAAKQQILISTAVAMMNAAANPWPLPAIPLMATAALAGSLAYSQASSAASNQMAGLNAESMSQSASLKIGERQNTVNVASQATQGELSYIRGDSGVGSIGSFTPRAEGGLMTPGMSYIVGEHGPEVINPMAPVQATSNSDATGKSGGDSKSGGLVFSPNIQAMDAQSIIDRSDEIFSAFVHSAEQQGIDVFKLR